MMAPTYHRILPVGEFLTFSSKPAVSILYTEQTHSNQIVEYKGQSTTDLKVDGIMTSYESLGTQSIAIKTADCMPILFLGEKHVTFLHAGWRGLADGILQHSLIQKTKPFYAFIGPSIQKESFEVSSDFKNHFSENNFIQSSNRLFFNLQKEASDQIYQSYNGIKVVSCLEDTIQLPKFHSYRENKTSHRNWNIFKL